MAVPQRKPQPAYNYRPQPPSNKGIKKFIILMIIIAICIIIQMIKDGAI